MHDGVTECAKENVMNVSEIVDREEIDGTVAITRAQATVRYMFACGEGHDRLIAIGEIMERIYEVFNDKEYDQAGWVTCHFMAVVIDDVDTYIEAYSLPTVEYDWNEDGEISEGSDIGTASVYFRLIKNAVRKHMSERGMIGLPDIKD